MGDDEETALMDKQDKTAKEYLKTKVLTASPTQLQLMLYEGAIRFCEQARPAMENKEIEKSYHLIRKAEKIVMELSNSMRDEYAPEACANLRKLYMYCYDRLVKANLEKKPEPLDEALEVMRHMRESWLMLMEKIRQEKADASENDGGEGAEIESAFQEMMDQQVGANINFEG